ncbi:hypothetical protein G4G27_01090 [Sphingomonas sp. So64.6b]|uniref:hypothetical protein n=1 Tax=Sphingomonas sp. So64.6b TaxID=2997354 RepID=UPI001601ED05|nr:hypothetical protein [Sphingomonas sp. So64.6b]QNA82759.1 hypothetical protein G4G27_01090 [Sphingomonas sp. So64.6b]
MLIVSEPGDSFANALAGPIAAAGRIPVCLDATAAAQRFTVMVQDGDAIVTPRIPMIIRAPRVSGTRSADARFLQGEALAALWAIGALSTAPVLGRPGPMGFGGGCSLSASVNELRGGLRTDRMELFMQGATWPQSDTGWYFKSPDSLEPLSHDQRAAYPGPQRGRYVRPGEQYEFVLVLGRDAWCRSGQQVAGHDLALDSVMLAERLGLDMALIIWALSEDLHDPYLARITPWPHREDIGFAWDAFASAAISHLTQ